MYSLAPGYALFKVFDATILQEHAYSLSRHNVNGSDAIKVMHSKVI